MNQYIFDNTNEEREFQRLQLVEAANDPTTISLLEETGIQPGWQCLELGAGAGSILRWLGNRVGPTGLAVGVDKKTRYLHHDDSPHVQIHQGSFLDVPLEQSFDLLHSRYVLIHNQEEGAILTKLCSLLKPGGWAIFEEPDFTSTTLTDWEQETSQGRVNRAISQMFINVGLDPAYALRLPHTLEESGFHIVRSQSLMHLCLGNSPMAKVMEESVLVLEQEYCKTGLCSSEDIQQYVSLSQDSTHWALYHSTTSVIARKPIM